jgi:hypothetical protein
MVSFTSGPTCGRSGRSTLNPHASVARDRTRIARIIFAFMGVLLLCLIRGRRTRVAEMKFPFSRKRRWG